LSQASQFERDGRESADADKLSTTAREEKSPGTRPGLAGDPGAIKDGAPG